MPFSAEFTEGGDALVCIGSGVVTGSDVLGAKASLLQDEMRLRSLRRVTVNLSGVVSLDVTPDDVRRVAQRESVQTTDLKVAVVTANDYVFAIARMWQVFANGSGWKTGVFRDVAEAEAWLRA